MKYSYTESELAIAVKSSTSFRQVLRKLNLKEAGGNYATIKKRINEVGLDTSHFSGRGWNKNKSLPKKPIEKYLNNECAITSHKLRLRLLKEGYFEHKCYECGLKLWNNQPIPLELEHIDGNHANNDLSNLTVLCPNCHAQTPTYRGKNISK